jgi:predicted RNA-binding Zn-ribbon protein involved in translation (DUF1610 family)
MFTLHNPVKTLNGSYVVTSHPCPMCGDTQNVAITSDKLFAYHQGAYAQEVLSDFDADIRERFISGTCPTCWDSMFSEDEDESYIDDYAEASLFGWEN